MKKLVKRIVPKSIIQGLKNSIELLDYSLIKLISKSKLLSKIYYLFNSKFNAEHHAVLAGRVAYKYSLIEIGSSCALLRRNIHRLEKGLIMKPRRDVFAEGFIQETVVCYKVAIESDQLAAEEKKWATDVLDEYFKVVASTKILDTARHLYTDSRNELSYSNDLDIYFPSEGKSYKPYGYSNLPANNVDFEELKNLYVRRRSVRWYENKEVPIDLIRKASNIASFAPSACNRQPYRFLFCNEKKKAVQIAKCAMGTAGFSENLPAIIAIIGDLSAYPHERDRHVIYIDASLAAMQLMLALETLGLSTCSINWPDLNANERIIRDIIDLKIHEKVVMLMAVGYADNTGGIPYSQKKQNDLILEDISK
jgi:nitroreductase